MKEALIKIKYPKSMYHLKDNLVIHTESNSVVAELELVSFNKTHIEMLISVKEMFERKVKKITPTIEIELEIKCQKY